MTADIDVVDICAPIFLPKTLRMPPLPLGKHVSNSEKPLALETL